MISEQTDRAQAAGYTVVFRGLVGTAGTDSHVLEQELPLFVLDFLLGNKTFLKEPVKISFILFPWGESGQAGFPELPNAYVTIS